MDPYKLYDDVISDPYTMCRSNCLGCDRCAGYVDNHSDLEFTNGVEPQEPFNTLLLDNALRLNEKVIIKEINRNIINTVDMLKFSKNYMHQIILSMGVIIVILDSMTKNIFLGIACGGLLDLVIIILYSLKVKFSNIFTIVNIILITAYSGLILYLYLINYCICFLSIILNNYLGGTIMFLAYQYLASYIISYNKFTYIYNILKIILVVSSIFLYYFL
jgi:hypothetical protein